jgi:putative phosphoribosyl transferase
MFESREAAGEKLAEKLLSYAHRKDVIVLGLPRGGVVVAKKVAEKLAVPLDILAVRKIGMPGNPELAIGAVTPDGQKFFDWSFIATIGIDEEYIKKSVEKEIGEAQRRVALYRAGRTDLHLHGKTVILVDDGVATGATIKVAIQSVKASGAQKIVVAVPVAPQSFIHTIKNKIDSIICLEVPDAFYAVGSYYKNFTQVDDDEVARLLKNEG